MRIQKRQFIIAVFATFLVFGFGYAKMASADDSSITPPTPAQLAVISQNCVQIKSTLQQLSQNDLLVRNNAGQFYDEISSNLMAPMNSRIALNHFDGANLVTTAASYSSQIVVFRADYLVYASNLQVALNDDCSNANQFYNDLITAQHARIKLGQDVVILNSSIAQYAQQFSDFSKTLPQGGTNG